MNMTLDDFKQSIKDTLDDPKILAIGIISLNKDGSVSTGYPSG
jgi:hypothetical protein